MGVGGWGAKREEIEVMLQISQVFSKGSGETPSDTDGKSGKLETETSLKECF